MDAQADLRLCYPQHSEDRFSPVKAHMIVGVGSEYEQDISEVDVREYITDIL